MSMNVEGVVRDGKIVLVDGPELMDGQHVRVVIDSETEKGQVLTPLEGPILIDLLGRIRQDRQSRPPRPSRPSRTSAAGRLADDPTWDEHLQEVLESRKSDPYRESVE